MEYYFILHNNLRIKKKQQKNKKTKKLDLFTGMFFYLTFNVEIFMFISLLIGDQ